jgi:hypothetical protein
MQRVRVDRPREPACETMEQRGLTRSRTSSAPAFVLIYSVFTDPALSNAEIDLQMWQGIGRDLLRNFSRCLGVSDSPARTELRTGDLHSARGHGSNLMVLVLNRLRRVQKNLTSTEQQLKPLLLIGVLRSDAGLRHPTNPNRFTGLG